MTNFERIKNMNIKQMAVMLADEIPHGDCYGCGKCHNILENKIMNDCCQEGWLIWLESEEKGH